MDIKSSNSFYFSSYHSIDMSPFKVSGANANFVYSVLLYVKLK